MGHDVFFEGVFGSCSGAVMYSVDTDARNDQDVERNITAPQRKKSTQLCSQLPKFLRILTSDKHRESLRPGCDTGRRGDRVLGRPGDPGEHLREVRPKSKLQLGAPGLTCKKIGQQKCFAYLTPFVEVPPAPCSSCRDCFQTAAVVFLELHQWVNQGVPAVARLSSQLLRRQPPVRDCAEGTIINMEQAGEFVDERRVVFLCK